MSTSRQMTWGRVVALAGAALLAGCIVVPAGGRGGHAGYGGGPVMVAPPPLQHEAHGVAPGPGFFWIGGFWHWLGGRHVWSGGRWEAPRQGHQWQPHRWSRDGQGWRAEPGRWERR